MLNFSKINNKNIVMTNIILIIILSLSKFRFTKIDILFKPIKIVSRDKTLNEILYNSKSIARFGDGEFEIIFGKNIRFQKFNETLKKKLLKVINSSFPNLLVGLINLVNITDQFWINWIGKNKMKLLKVINKN